jgi:flagellar biosynthetic protein FlhB
VEFVKNLAKVVVVAGVGLWLGGSAVTAMWQVPGFLPERIMDHSAGAAMGMLLATGAMLAAIAAADVIWKRARWLKKQRMSLREVRDEHKDSEGDPLIRAKRAGIRRQRARQRMSTAVPTATVVITNPTHFAVALRYDMGRDVSPVCVAKGTDRVASHEYGNWRAMRRCRSWKTARWPGCCTPWWRSTRKSRSSTGNPWRRSLPM